MCVAFCVFIGVTTHSHCVFGCGSFLRQRLLEGSVRVGEWIHIVSGCLVCEIFNNFIIYIFYD